MMLLLVSGARSNTIEEVLNEYFVGHKCADVLIKKTFHYEARLYSIDEGNLDKTEMADWPVGRRTGREKEKSAKGPWSF